MHTTAFLFLLAKAAYTDYREKRLPDSCIAGLFILAASAACVCEEPAFPDRLAGFFAVSAPLFLLALFVPGSFGGGDIKLTAACGLFLGVRAELTAFFYALCGAGIYSVYLVLYKNKSKKEEFALGPFLASGVCLSLFFPVF